ncbi:MAG TPA: YkgJ family cysteine cluster protein [Verrucomicrobiae bacterium]|nr:YkgJ family cysteine cluster protein [Verrucomicrobiae bacterium]
MPIFHECQRCTACCRWPGQVRLTAEEISRLAAFRGQSEREFIQQSTRLTHDRRGLALQEQADGACVFLVGNNCAVQPVKPQQCRDFPNLWRHPDADKLCRAVPRNVSEDEYGRLLSQATGRTLESIRELTRLSNSR